MTMDNARLGRLNRLFKVREQDNRIQSEWACQKCGATYLLLGEVRFNLLSECCGMPLVHYVVDLEAESSPEEDERMAKARKLVFVVVLATLCLLVTVALLTGRMIWFS